MSKAKYLITLVFVFLMLSGFFTSTSLAKNERELAEKLAQQFKFYELAEEILLKELDRTDITDKDKEVDYKYKCAESLRDVYKWHAAHLERLNQPVKAKEYRDKAEKLMDEWTEKRYGDDERGQIFRAGQILTDGSNLINRAKFEEYLPLLNFLWQSKMVCFENPNDTPIFSFDEIKKIIMADGFDATDFWFIKR